MDEAWIDIILPATPNLHALNPPATAAHHGVILQDMLNFTPTGAGDLGAAEPARFVMATRREQLTACFPTALPNSLLDPTSSSSLFNCFPMKESVNSEETQRRADRRYMRKMKNRESAARSRNRRLAYTSELETKKIDLTEENVRLRKEIRKQQLGIAVATAAVAAISLKEARKKRNLSISLSALF